VKWHVNGISRSVWDGIDHLIPQVVVKINTVKENDRRFIRISQFRIGGNFAKICVNHFIAVIRLLISILITLGWCLLNESRFLSIGQP
jgi:hypothetical protein